MADVTLESTEEIIQLVSVSGASQGDITTAVNAEAAARAAADTAHATSPTAHNLTANISAALTAAASPSAGNPFATIAGNVPIFIGGNSPSVDDTAFNVGRNFPTSANSHAYRDESTLAMSGASTGYASFDAQFSVSSNAVIGHIAGSQSRPSYTGGGTIGEFRGFWSQLDHTGAGTVTAAKNYIAAEPLGAGPITTLYGFYVETLTRGSTNWAIYTNGATPSFFGGPVEFNDTLRVDGLAAFGNVAPNVSYQVYVASNLDATKTAAVAALAVAPINLNTGSTYGLFFSNIAQNNTLAAIGNNFVYGMSGIAGVYATGANSAARYTYGGRYQSSYIANPTFTSTAIGAFALWVDVISATGAGTISIGETVGLQVENQGTAKTPNSYAIRVASQSGSGTASYAFYSSAGRHRFGDSTALISFYGATPQTQQILATGAGATADNIISFLQTIGLCKQS